MLQCGAVCYSVLHCVAVCCSGVGVARSAAAVSFGERTAGGAVFCSVLQCVAVVLVSLDQLLLFLLANELQVVQRVVMCCSVLQCGAVCCSVLQWCWCRLIGCRCIFWRTNCRWCNVL